MYVKVMEVSWPPSCVWVSWLPTVCSLPMCACMSVWKWEVCSVEMLLMELEVVHNRRDIISERAEGENETEGKMGKEKRKQ